MPHDFRTSKQLKGLRGAKVPVYSAGRTLTREDAGATCYGNSAAGDTYTLPPAELGLDFEFGIIVTITSNAFKVITATGDFIVGVFRQSSDSTYTVAERVADGSTHVAWSGNGTTTGGYAGDWFKLTAISDTQWAITGMGRATGTEATPFATS